MKRLALVVLAATLLLCSWGPITHEVIGEAAANGDYALNFNNSAFYTGCVLPDVALAIDGSDQTRQARFHSAAYVTELKARATTSEQWHFIYGYEVHLIADKVEGEYGKFKGSQPVNLEYAVDRLIGTTGKRVDITDGIASLMAAAYAAVCDDSVVDAAWIKSAQLKYNVYLGRFYIPVSQSDAEFYYSDYWWWTEKAIADCKAYLESLRPVVKGDVNCDGKLTAVDAMFVAQYVVGARELSEEAKRNADVNNDGKVTSVDAMYLSQSLVGMRPL